jgi:hypothetical protein
MGGVTFFLLIASHIHAQSAPAFYKDILPILRDRCQSCHTVGDIGPMPLSSYAEVRPWAAAIREAVKLRKMPPWFADPAHGHFANDPRLSDDEVALIEAWVRAGAPEGPQPKTTETRHLGKPAFSADTVLTVAAPFPIPANAVIDYQYFVLPTRFNGDRWVRGVRIRPSDRSVVHHAVLYVRNPSSQWLREAKPGVAYAPLRSDPEAVRRSRDTKEDILAVYTPGASATIFPEGMAKKIPAGADLILQLHYTSKKTPATDAPRVGLMFMSQQPSKRILTLQMGRDDLRIPPGDRHYRASVSGTLPGDALLISLFPHMHLRGAAFEFDIVRPGGHVETLLKVKPYNFNWQLNYVLKTPRLLSKGTRLRWTGYFDNSANNPYNPDPTAEVTWGEQSWEEMMIGFFDVAVDPALDKKTFFIR